MFLVRKTYKNAAAADSLERRKPELHEPQVSEPCSVHCLPVTAWRRRRQAVVFSLNSFAATSRAAPGGPLGLTEKHASAI